MYSAERREQNALSAHLHPYKTCTVSSATCLTVGLISLSHSPRHARRSFLSPFRCFAEKRCPTGNLISLRAVPILSAAPAFFHLYAPSPLPSLSNRPSHTPSLRASHWVPATSFDVSLLRTCIFPWPTLFSLSPCLLVCCDKEISSVLRIRQATTTTTHHQHAIPASLFALSLSPSPSALRRPPPLKRNTRPGGACSSQQPSRRTLHGLRNSQHAASFLTLRVINNPPSPCCHLRLVPPLTFRLQPPPSRSRVAFAVGHVQQSDQR
jgi:hypothetical protein